MPSFRCHTDLVFDVQGGNIENGTNVILYEDNGTDNQAFHVNRRGGGYVSIDLADTGFSLDVQAGNFEDGTNVILWEYHGGDNQLWNQEHVGGMGGKRSIIKLVVILY